VRTAEQMNERQLVTQLHFAVDMYDRAVTSGMSFDAVDELADDVRRWADLIAGRWSVVIKTSGGGQIYGPLVLLKR